MHVSKQTNSSEVQQREATDRTGVDLCEMPKMGQTARNDSTTVYRRAQLRLRCGRLNRVQKNEKVSDAVMRTKVKVSTLPGIITESHTPVVLDENLQQELMKLLSSSLQEHHESSLSFGVCFTVSGQATDDGAKPESVEFKSFAFTIMSIAATDELSASYVHLVGHFDMCLSVHLLSHT